MDNSNDLILHKNLTEGELRFQLTFAIYDGIIKDSKVKTDKKNGLVSLNYYVIKKMKLKIYFNIIIYYTLNRINL